MALNLSPKEIKAIGKMWEPSLFTQDEIDELVSKVSPEVRLKGLKPEVRLRGLPTEEIEAYLKQRKQQS